MKRKLAPCDSNQQVAPLDYGPKPKRVEPLGYSPIPIIRLPIELILKIFEELEDDPESYMNLAKSCKCLYEAGLGLIELKIKARPLPVFYLKDVYQLYSMMEGNCVCLDCITKRSRDEFRALSFRNSDLHHRRGTLPKPIQFDSSHDILYHIYVLEIANCKLNRVTLLRMFVWLQNVQRLRLINNEYYEESFKKSVEGKNMIHIRLQSLILSGRMSRQVLAYMLTKFLPKVLRDYTTPLSKAYTCRSQPKKGPAFEMTETEKKGFLNANLHDSKIPYSSIHYEEDERDEEGEEEYYQLDGYHEDEPMEEDYDYDAYIDRLLYDIENGRLV